MIEAVVPMLAILVGGAVGGTLQRSLLALITTKNSISLQTGVAMGTILVALGIFMLLIH
jgi:hypothetical protein